MNPIVFAYRTSLAVMLLFFLLILPCLAQNSSDCILSLNRVVGRRDIFNWACVCRQLLSRRNALALATVNAPMNESDTVGRGIRIARCAEHSAARLTEVCSRDPAAFVDHGVRVLNQCIHEPLSPEEEALDQPFTYDKSNCTARFARLNDPASSRVSGSWLCECVQGPGYDVISGIAEYFTRGDPETSIAEWQRIRECTEIAEQQLREVCFESPGDFEILSFHLLQACCKRDRVDSNTKFECQVVAPNDVGKFKIANNDLL